MTSAAERSQGARLILLHEVAVADYVSGKNSGKSALHGGLPRQLRRYGHETLDRKRRNGESGPGQTATWLAGEQMSGKDREPDPRWPSWFVAPR